MVSNSMKPYPLKEFILRSNTKMSLLYLCLLVPGSFAKLQVMIFPRQRRVRQVRENVLLSMFLPKASKTL